jgi:DNA-directed RNA polymerase specialized sigma24 family protein
VEYQPRASDEMVQGYLRASELATQRADLVAKRSEVEAVPWRTLAQYCDMMAKARALDDDQFQGQRKGMRHSKTVPMSKELMEATESTEGLSVIWPTENQGIPEWKWAAMELALGHLSPLQRVCYEMFYAGRLSYRDIADALSMSLSEVKNAVSRANRKFKKRIRPTLAHIFEEKRGG